MGSDTPLAAYQGALYASWEAGSSSELEYATFNGTSWSSPAAIGATSLAGPALAVKGTLLYESWINDSTGAVDWAYFNGTSWTAAKAIPDTSGLDEIGPAISGYDGALYDAWVANSLGIDYSVRA